MAVRADQITFRDLSKNLIEETVDQLRDRSDLDRSNTMVKVHTLRRELPMAIEAWSLLQFLNLGAIRSSTVESLLSSFGSEVRIRSRPFTPSFADGHAVFCAGASVACFRVSASLFLVAVPIEPHQTVSRGCSPDASTGRMFRRLRPQSADAAAVTAAFVALRTSGATPLIPRSLACLDQRVNSLGLQRMTNRLVSVARARPGFFFFATARARNIKRLT